MVVPYCPGDCRGEHVCAEAFAVVWRSHGTGRIQGGELSRALETMPGCVCCSLDPSRDADPRRLLYMLFVVATLQRWSGRSLGERHVVHAHEWVVDEEMPEGLRIDDLATGRCLREGLFHSARRLIRFLDRRSIRMTRVQGADLPRLVQCAREVAMQASRGEQRDFLLGVAIRLEWICDALRVRRPDLAFVPVVQTALNAMRLQPVGSPAELQLRLALAHVQRLQGDTDAFVKKTDEVTDMCLDILERRGHVDTPSEFEGGASICRIAKFGGVCPIAS